MFVLDKPKSDKPTFIFVKKMINGQKLKYSLKVKIHPDNWNKAQERAYPSRKDKLLQKECFDINLLLERVEDAISPSKSLSEAQARLSELTGAPSQSDFFEFIDRVIEDRKSGNAVTASGKLYSKETIKAYGQTKKYLQGFEQENKIKLSFNLSASEYDLLISYLTSQKHSLNTIGRTAAHLRMFLYVAQKKGYKVPILSEKVIKRFQEDAFDIYLTEEKILKLYNTETNEGYETLAKEWFVIGCFTGLRVSDLVLLTNDKIIKDNITLANEKTDVRVVIPLHWTVREILEKHGGFPKSIPDQKLNEYVKIVAEKAKFEDLISYTITKGGKRVDMVKPEFEMISTHTGRRSFITNLLKSGFSESIVMKLSGIKDSRTLAKYNKVSHEEVADIVRQTFSKRKDQ